MEASTENALKSDNDFQRLQHDLGISFWENSLTLPDGDQQHSDLELQWEQKLGFTFHRSEDHNNKVNVYISDQTHYTKLFQFLPFWFSDFEVFLCPPQLIRNRMAILGKEEDFKAHNQATQQLMFILEHATRNKASDIHIENLAEKRRVRVRVDGILKQLEMSEGLEDNVITKIKLISGMDIAKKRSPQDGHFPYLSNDGERYDLRTSTIPSVNGEKIVIRLLPSTRVQFSMEGMGFPQENISLIKEILTA
ncbi:MAG: Flp pilus assembly complex ATPase component, partial [Proteobacteria bacterium]|nr:Flp pilus assembly complex ATPase component [Pseudomonadota bacterium]